ncbi:MAG: PIG-L family deacetylase, partial [Terracidiphilus sp.]
MIRFENVQRAATCAVLAGLMVTGAQRAAAQEKAQQSAPAGGAYAAIPLPEPNEIALPLPEDRGCAALEQSLRRMGTTASVMMIVAHPDDEDGALLTYLSRGLGARATLLTLNRGEGGQNAMSADAYDALGIIRTNELLKADEYYGAKQLWGTEVDFGFSKTQEQSFERWGHDRVLYDAVLAVRRERPQVIVSTFVGGITDGHGQHQVSGEIAQEVFKAAGDPKVFPEQLKNGLQPWHPLAVYSMVPFAPIK